MTHQILTRALRSLLRVAGEDVLFHAGDHSVQLRAVPGKRDMVANMKQGLSIESDSQDWIVLACDLVIDGQHYLPQRGDTIQACRRGQVYEVLPDSNSEQCFRLDAHQVQLRIHSKLVQS